ncbi:DUF4328 domain-containing protein [Streptomyces sp. V1I1]|uniref:DUF4328 domain-containing protein n=1 Tax=Streptomyces sp. V1I1 TaxID=3042272 RepID=UPI0027D84664|nr:DUF4328 domain-containing protein [Streptomyces sp. V1I1]
MDTATTKEGLCDACAPAATAETAAPAAPPAPASTDRAEGQDRPWPAGGLRSPVGLSYAVVGLLCFVIAADVFALFTAVPLSRLTATVRDGGFEAYLGEDLERADVLIGYAGRLQTALMGVTAILFIAWFRRVRFNAGVFAPDLQQRGPGWAVGGWFIPIGNLFIPRGIAANIWAASRQDPYATRKQEPHTVINIWWIAWLAANLLPQVASSQYDSSRTPDAYKAAGTAFIVADLVDIVAALLAILVVRRLTRMQLTKAMRGAEKVAV